MSKFNDLKKFCLSVLEQHCSNTFYGQAAPGSFPRLEFDLKELSAQGEAFDRYVLTVNLYDRKTSQTIDDIADSIVCTDGKAEYVNADYYYKIFYNQDRQPVADPDKTIQHIMMTFEVRVFTRSDFNNGNC